MEHADLYKVLLVDDDPIMLTGIKRMIDWEKNRCIISGTASSAEEALEKLRALQPNVVICDIVMTGASGLDLLKQAYTEFPDVVFIMLSNHSKFDFVRDSLSYQAATYLVKTSLESTELEQALNKAILEQEKRNKLHKADELLHTRRQQEALHHALIRFLCDPEQPQDLLILRQKNMLVHFAFAYISLNFTVLPHYAELSEEKHREILDWEMDISTRLAASFFANSLILSLADDGSLLLFVWGIQPLAWKIDADRFRERLIKISKQITQLGVEVLPSEWYSDITAETQGSPARLLKRMRKEYILSGKGMYSDVVEKALQYILTNVEKRIMLQDVADFVSISPGYLSTLFKREYHQNLMDFVNQTKVDHACELLKDNKYRINEIAYMLGFESAYYFTRIFRRYIGVSPSEFRVNTLT